MPNIGWITVCGKISVGALPNLGWITVCGKISVSALPNLGWITVCGNNSYTGCASNITTSYHVIYNQYRGTILYTYCKDTSAIAIF